MKELSSEIVADDSKVLFLVAGQTRLQTLSCFKHKQLEARWCPLPEISGQ
jgi:hypothetical protein